MTFEQMLRRAKGGDQEASTSILLMYRPLLLKYAVINGRLDEDLYQELLAEDRAREEAQAVEANAKVAVAQAEAGVLAEDADAAEADFDSVEE